jgi:hypothetical protein
MAILGRRQAIRDIGGLARRVFERLRAYPRVHGGQGVPINDTLSQILEHEKAYQPLRPRKENKQRAPLQNPGIFTVQEDVADVLDTTIGDLMGEAGYAAARDLISTDDRRKLRQAFRLLRDLFDLDDESLDQVDEPVATPSNVYRFVVPPEEFIERDHDYPRALHAWVVPDVPAAAGETGAGTDIDFTETQVLHSVREVWDSRLQVVRVIGDSMAPELRDGWKVLVDTQQTKPAEGALVAVYVKYQGGILGRWSLEGNQPILVKTNNAFPNVRLGNPDEWKLWGTVTQIVGAPVELTKRQSGDRRPGRH